MKRCRLLLTKRTPLTTAFCSSFSLVYGPRVVTLAALVLRTDKQFFIEFWSETSVFKPEYLKNQTFLLSKILGNDSLDYVLSYSTNNSKSKIWPQNNCSTVRKSGDEICSLSPSSWHPHQAGKRISTPRHWTISWDGNFFLTLERVIYTRKQKSWLF